MIKFNVEVITPEMAETIIENNKRLFKETNGNKQRNVRWKTVDGYAKDMLEGRWKENGETIKFDKEGRLMDGQHRIWAVIKSGVPTEFLVVRGIENSAMDTIDVGLKRSLENALQFQAESYESGAAPIVKAKMQLDKKNKNLGQSNANAEVTPPQMVEEYIKNECLYKEAVNYAKKKHKESEGTLKPAEVGSIYLHLTSTLNYDKEIVKEFFERLCSIRRNEKSIYKITMDKLDSIKKMSQERINEYMSCWNAMIKGNSYNRPKPDEYSWFLPPKEVA